MVELKFLFHTLVGQLKNLKISLIISRIVKEIFFFGAGCSEVALKNVFFSFIF